MILEDILTSNNVVLAINQNLDSLVELIPELRLMFNFEHKHPHHHLDVWNHTLLALSISENNFVIRLALLLHDIGKPLCYTEKDGVRHFHGHPEVSSKMAEKILYRLGYDKETIDLVTYLIAFHDTPMKEEDIKNDREKSILRYKVQYSDAYAHNPQKLEKRIAYLNSIEEMLNKETNLKHD